MSAANKNAVLFILLGILVLIAAQITTHQNNLHELAAGALHGVGIGFSLVGLFAYNRRTVRS